MSESKALVGLDAFELDQRRAKAYAESGYWPDAASIAKALVKIEAGRALGLPPIVAMSEVHVIEGSPTLGAGALATLVKMHPRYDYEVVELTPERCELRFYEAEKLLGDSTFVLEDAQKAGLLGRGPWKQYPRNMLFARAMSNGVAWYCPDVTTGRFYVPEELDGGENASLKSTAVDIVVPEDVEFEPVPTEEQEAQADPSTRETPQPDPSDEERPYDERQRREREQLLEALAEAAPKGDWRAFASAHAGPLSDLTYAQAAALNRTLRRELERVTA